MFKTIQPTSAETTMPLPGDDIVPNADIVMNRAFTLPGSPEIIWPWFMQLGKNRSGWYFPSSVELFIPKKRRGIRHIEPSLQNLKVGKVIDDWGGRDAKFEVAILEPPTTLVHKSKRGNTYASWSITLHAQADNTTRVILRLRMSPIKNRWLVESIGDLFDALTVAGLAAGLRERLTEANPSDASQ